MPPQPDSTDRPEPGLRWLARLFGCFSRQQCPETSKEAEGNYQSVEHEGIERQVTGSHIQPHLIPPMKLVLFNDIPESPRQRPGSSWRVSQWVSEGRDLAFRASDQASLTIRRKFPRQSISALVPASEMDHIPVQRSQLRPLQVSICLAENRLSGLPEFDKIGFTSTGEIRMPPKALLRPRSEDMARSLPPLYNLDLSVTGESQSNYWQQRMSSPDSQRPRSAFEGLNSHPVDLPTPRLQDTESHVYSRLPGETCSKAAAQKASTIRRSVPVLGEHPERPPLGLVDPTNIAPSYSTHISNIDSRPTNLQLKNSRSSDSLRTFNWLSQPATEPSSRNTESPETKITSLTHPYQHTASSSTFHRAKSTHIYKISHQHATRHLRTHSTSDTSTDVDQHSYMNNFSPSSSSSPTSSPTYTSRSRSSNSTINSSPPSSHRSHSRSLSSTLQSTGKHVTMVAENEVEQKQQQRRRRRHERTDQKTRPSSSPLVLC